MCENGRGHMTHKLTVVYSFLFICLVLSGCTPTDSSPQEPEYPTLQPAPGQIAFTSTRDNGSGTIYVVNSDGTGLTRITDPDLYAHYPRWTPGCDKIAFSARDGVYVVNPDGSGLSRLIALPDFALASWSPNGKHVAFSVLDETLPRGDNIWVANGDGSERRQLTRCSIHCALPMWHPGGEDIFYLSDENDYTTPPIRTTLNRTNTKGPVHEVWLSASEMTGISLGAGSISPDGTKFVLVREVDEEEHTDIFTLDIENKEWQRLTDDEAYYDWPAWSPDGQQIVFVSYRVPTVPTTRRFPSVAGIWIMNADGSGRFQVVEPEGDNLEPDWCAR
jgi:Tol biopolymer transport system component